MSNYDKLKALGADIVGGDLIWKHKVLGSFRNGDLVLTEDGLAALEIEDAVVVTKPAAKKAKKADAAPAPEPTSDAPAGDAPAGDEPELTIDE